MSQEETRLAGAWATPAWATSAWAWASGPGTQEEPPSTVRRAAAPLVFTKEGMTPAGASAPGSRHAAGRRAAAPLVFTTSRKEKDWEPWRIGEEEWMRASLT
ncbi:unnamed protein product [Urochloa humidicola]